MRQFYLLFPNRNALRSDLNWTHYRLLIRVENEAARNWYMAETAAEGWSTRALERQINSFYYERLLSSQDRQPVRSEAIQQTAELSPRDILKDPYVLEFLELGERGSFTESELESALIGQLQGFLLELGKGFSFVARQRRIDLEGERFYIDLVFYNYLLKCFVLIDLKLGKLTHQDIGQMDTYVRMYEERFRGADDNPTLGLILCSERNEAIAKYSVLAESQQIFASKYRLVLPTEEELVAGLRGIMK
jgi:predicted nuclease of restriction endonuclease-like (RecB) superfamily